MATSFSHVVGDYSHALLFVIEREYDCDELLAGNGPCGLHTHLHHIRQLHPRPRRGSAHHDQSLKERRGRSVIRDINSYLQWKNSESCALASLTSHFIAFKMLAFVGSFLGSLVSSVKTKMSSGLKFQFPAK